MSDFDTDPDLVVPDELETLKARALVLGVSFHPSIGLEKLKEKVNAAAAAEPDTPPVVAPVAAKARAAAPVEETLTARRIRKKREANELLRIRVSCMNPAKKEWDGEIFASGNSLVGTFTKYVPFNAEEGWHVPRIIYNQLVERQCQIFVTTRDARGNKSRTGKLIKEFAIEILPSLTPAELNDLAQRQAMAKTID